MRAFLQKVTKSFHIFKLANTFLFLLVFFVHSTIIVEAGGINPWATLIGVAGISGLYKGELNAVLDFGNSSYNQAWNFHMDMAKNGRDQNPSDWHLINEIFEKIITRADYVIDARSLPFRIGINDLEEVNACCYPTNYISINRGLIESFSRQKDELAAVIGHEMTHGLCQHSASVYAKSIAQFYGMTFLNAMTGTMDPYAVAVLADYSAAKNFTLPIEYEADRGGFYLMTSAGFNPGAGAAAMVRLDFLTQHSGIQDEPYDHPSTVKREKRLSEMLTAYSAGHVTVIDRKYIAIDDEIILSSDWTDPLYDNTAENAYLIAGSLARAFHDYSDFASWNFQEAKNGRIRYLTDAEDFAILKHFIEREKKEEVLRDAVSRAYKKEKSTLSRKKMLDEEQTRKDTMNEHRHKNTLAESKRIKEMIANADAYVDLGDFKRATFLFQRASESQSKEHKASLLASWARLFAYTGDVQKAITMSDEALALDDKDPYNFLNRADVFRSLGKPYNAILALQEAAKIEQLPITYKMLGDLKDEIGHKKEAQVAYDEYLKLTADKKSIPKEYLKEK